MSVAENFKFSDLLVKAAEMDVSDLHLSVGGVVKARIDGDLVDWNETIVNQEMVEKNLFSILNDAQKDEFQKHGSLLWTFDFADNLRFRVQLFRQEGRLTAILRYIPKHIKSMTELCLPQVLNVLANLERGLIIISGTNGAGKTTTAMVLLEAINNQHNKSIFTIEKPIEYLLNNKKSLIEQRGVGVDVASFAQASQDLLLSDTDVIFCNRVNDEVTAANLLELAEKSLVVLELASQDVLDSLSDFLTFFPAINKHEKRQIFSRNLITILNQVLVKRRNGGRLPALEIMFNNNAVAAAIADDRASRIPDIIIMSGHEGMISRERSLAELVKNGEVLMDEAIKYARNKDDFKEMIMK